MVTLHLKLLRNIGYIPYTLQYIFIACLTPNHLYLIPFFLYCPYSTLVTTNLSSMSVNLLLLLCLLVCCSFGCQI